MQFKASCRVFGLCLLVFLPLFLGSCKESVNYSSNFELPGYRPVITDYAVSFRVPDNWRPKDERPKVPDLVIYAEGYSGPVKGEAGISVKLDNSPRLDAYRELAALNPKEFEREIPQLQKFYTAMFGVLSSAGGMHGKGASVRQVKEGGHAALMVAIDWRHEKSGKYCVTAMKYIFLDGYVVETVVTTPRDAERVEETTAYRVAASTTAGPLSYLRLMEISGKDIRRANLATREVEISGVASFLIPHDWVDTEKEGKFMLASYIDPNSKATLAIQEVPKLFHAMYNRLFDDEGKPLEEAQGFFFEFYSKTTGAQFDCKIEHGDLERIELENLDSVYMRSN